MIIAVNGKVIDTINIYAIEEVVSNDGMPYFDIIMFNNINLEVSNRFDNCYTKSQMPEILEKLEAVRQSIIAIWNKSNSEIPQFNF